MSAYQTFANLPAALADFAAGLCRRHVRIDGHVIDLVQAAAEAGRRRADPVSEAALALMRGNNMVASDPAAWDEAVARLTAEALGAAPPELPPLAEPALPAPPDDASAYRCPWCSRPWDGAL